ncbi:ABC transporter permease [Sediminispirochaeta smaragdinae]|uniref:Binding-protein-dependent transport systems inner membrane component n=1 Tax=Sediminispirochaeta smaragdinae (strain DSM 11293 / JCM 15392 / SEBR 4228) TaxID=573413 RepID=E1R4D9_SEDSS|nr:ABC transporter permease [Sediminispirochaeta smaragdinae]ADK81680.1 binding-protein-dependent transport systems inner membrane component [Sediminispirochaeta smaragdinae DSM 11293]
MKRKNIKSSGSIVNRGSWGLVLFRFRKNKLAMIGLVVIMILVIASLTAPLYIDYETVYTQCIKDRFLTPGTDGHILGTDQLGRDLFARIIYGGRISLLAGLITVAMALALGVLLGGVAGYFGGWVDNVIMRFCDVFMAVPRMLLAMAVSAALGQGTFKMVIALSVAAFPRFARVVRSSILSLRGQEFIEAARCYGSSSPRIIYKHIIPNGLGPVIISATLSLGSTILSIASLGFLGIGVAPPTPEWGTILAENRINIRYYPHLGLVPGLFIVVCVMCLNFMGDGLRDAMDPRSKV